MSYPNEKLVFIASGESSGHLDIWKALGRILAFVSLKDTWILSFPLETPRTSNSSKILMRPLHADQYLLKFAQFHKKIGNNLLCRCHELTWASEVREDWNRNTSLIGKYTLRIEVIIHVALYYIYKIAYFILFRIPLYSTWLMFLHSMYCHRRNAYTIYFFA